MTIGDTASRQRIADAGTEDLRRMVGLDPHRPGSARGRLLAEQIPVWTIIGQIGATGGTTEPDQIAAETIAQVAAEYDVSEAAVAAALLYYEQHRGAIDALLEANAAALKG